MKAIYLVVLLLSGCVTEESIRRDQEAYLNGLASRCSAYGMPPGSQQMQQCMMQLDLATQQSKAQSDATNAFLLQQGLNGLNQPAMVVPAPAPSYPTNMNCHRTLTGNTECTMR